MESKIYLNFEGQQELKGVYLIYRLAENLHSSIEQQSNFDNARQHWSTLFIQAHFACDLLSNMNWPAFRDENILEPWSDETARTLTAVDRMREMLSFCYISLGNEAPALFNRLLADKHKNIQDPVLILGCKGLPVSLHEPLSNFKDRFEKITQDINLSRYEHATLLYKMMRYIYSVRENFLRGFAFITIPLDENMQLRFHIYSDVLLAVCELVFYSVEQSSNWRRDDEILPDHNKSYYATLAARESHLRNRTK